MKKLFLIVISLLSIVSLSGCMSINNYPVDTTNTNLFLGTWTGHIFVSNDKNGNSIAIDGQSISITFFSNGTYWTAKRVLHNWTLKENQRIFASTQDIIVLNTLVFLYKFSNDNTSLYLYGPNGCIWLTKINTKSWNVIQDVIWGR